MLIWQLMAAPLLPHPCCLHFTLMDCSAIPCFSSLPALPLRAPSMQDHRKNAFVAHPLCALPSSGFNTNTCQCYSATSIQPADKTLMRRGAARQTSSGSRARAAARPPRAAGSTASPPPSAPPPAREKTAPWNGGRAVSAPIHGGSTACLPALQPAHLRLTCGSLFCSNAMCFKRCTLT